MSSTAGGLTVAVTGPTGDIGRAFLQAIERSPEVAEVRGMARRPFDPQSEGLRKVRYVQGDILDENAVRSLVAQADVVVHLAFLIWGSHEETRRVNLDGSRNVFRAALDASVSRLVYTSSVAAYGWHEDNPQVLTEDVPPRGTESHYYSAQKAELERELNDVARHHSADVYVFRPCIVAGPSAVSLIERIPYVRLGEKIPERLKKIASYLPVLRPVVPDPGIPFQLVHEDDVAQALVAAVEGKGSPGAYNLAGDGEITASDVAHALGWYALPLHDIAVDATIKIVSLLPLPATASWINAVRVPVLMDCSKAKRELGWTPRYDVLETLAETIHAARLKGIAPTTA